MTDIKLDTNVPLPTVVSFKYPFDDMNIGDSFFVPGTEAIRKLRGAASYHARKSSAKYSVRTTEEGDNVGARCWRVA